MRPPSHDARMIVFRAPLRASAASASLFLFMLRSCGIAGRQGHGKETRRRPVSQSTESARLVAILVIAGVDSPRLGSPPPFWSCGRREAGSESKKEGRIGQHPSTPATPPSSRSTHATAHSHHPLPSTRRPSTPPPPPSSPLSVMASVKKYDYIGPCSPAQQTRPVLPCPQRGA